MREAFPKVHPCGVTTVGWQPPERPQRTSRRRLLWVAAPLVAVFDVASVIGEIRSSDALRPGEVILSLLIAGPIVGLLLVLAPAAILANVVRSKRWIVAAEVLIALVICVVAVVVSGDEHSTAGIALIYIPIIGSAIAGAAAGGRAIG